MWTEADQQWWEANGEEWLRRATSRLDALECAMSLASGDILEALEFIN